MRRASATGGSLSVRIRPVMTSVPVSLGLTPGAATLAVAAGVDVLAGADGAVGDLVVVGAQPRKRTSATSATGNRAYGTRRTSPSAIR
jgi:hypothetical protein